ncbi:hypothetical protein Syun_029974 [Stephania yunnanensis]|uniref:Uncharacterized protein n=1 Tax=Stephania yunnanensis TaxID=152371 RepID=A0AAP0E6E8_9MAGN
MFFHDTFGLGVETLDYSCCTYGTLGCTRNPGERKWGHPLKGSWGYGNQVKGSGAPTKRILGVRRTV